MGTSAGTLWCRLTVNIYRKQPRGKAPSFTDVADPDTVAENGGARRTGLNKSWYLLY
jgi:hypothetical protein